MNDIPHLFAYRSGNTPLHRIPAGIKLLLMIAGTVCAFSGSNTALIALSIILVLLIPVSKMKTKTIFRNAEIIFWYAVFIFTFRIAGKPFEQGVFMKELHETGLYIWQIATVLFTGTFFYETTSNLEIRHTLSSIQNALKRLTGGKMRVPDVALLLSLTITFIPRIFETWKSLVHAWNARGGNRHKGIKGAWNRLTVLIPLLIIKLLSVASDTDRAIRNRSC
jgi:energy-coupling factor transporter transmembrane protein EcfT